uniref:DNA polymerase epsilon subunit 3 n=1 Tax=Kalanchoe fedtschenkoi TaxID=63787 RepID=A0A7N1A257_KALFE
MMDNCTAYEGNNGKDRRDMLFCSRLDHMEPQVKEEKLSQCSDAGDISLHKDALLAFYKSARVFIHYLSAAGMATMRGARFSYDSVELSSLSATANELCKESKRETTNADDVLKAIEEIDFPEFLGPLRASLEDYRQKNAKKRAGAAKAKEVNKKRKKEDMPPEDERNEVEFTINNDADSANDQEHQNDADEEGNKEAENELQDDVDKEGIQAEDKVDENDQHDASDAIAVEEEDDDSIRSNEQQNDADGEGNSINDDDEEDGANEA